MRAEVSNKIKRETWNIIEKHDLEKPEVTCQHHGRSIHETPVLSDIETLNCNTQECEKCLSQFLAKSAVCLQNKHVPAFFFFFFFSQHLGC